MIRRRYFFGGLIVAAALTWAASTLILAAGVGAKTQPAGGAKKGEVVTVTLFNTGDMHEKTGNLAKIAGFVKERKKKDPNVLFIDAGDFLDDGNLGEWPIKGTAGDAMMSLMAAAGYDVCILGNHDYKVGKDRMLELCQKHPKFPLVVCNMKWSDKDKEKAKGIPRYKIFELKGVKVAVVGSGSRYMNHAHGPPFPFFHEREGYREVLPEIRKKADIIVFVSHRWEGSDLNLLNAWGDDSPDVLIGGHSHKSIVWHRGQRLAKAKGGTLNIEVLIKAGALGRQLGMVTIKWDGKKIISTRGRIIPVARDWPEDAEVKALRAKYFAPKAKKKAA